jgi:ribosomal protein S12 methylthiotransferase accessory factor
MPAFARLMLLVEAIERAGLEVLLVDLTAPEIRQLGVSTVKVLVPGAYPMNFDSRWPHLGGARLTRAPVDAGLRDRPLDFAELNRTPHPFP